MIDIKKFSSLDEESRRVEIMSADVRTMEDAFLKVALGDESWRNRKAMIEKILDLSDKTPFIRPVADLLADDENAGLRNSAFELLIKLGDVAVPELQIRLNDPDAEMRKFAVDILGEIHSKSPVLQLIELSKSDNDENVRLAAIEALGKIADPSAIGHLRTLLDDESYLVRYSAIEALTKLGAEMDAGILIELSRIGILRKAVIEATVNSHDDRLLAVIARGLADKSKAVFEASLRVTSRKMANAGETAYTSAMKELDPVMKTQGTTDRIVEALASENRPLKKVAIHLIGVFGRNDLVEKVFANINDESYYQDIYTMLISMRNAPVDISWRFWNTLSYFKKLAVLSASVETGFDLPLSCVVDAIESEERQLRVTAIKHLSKNAGNIPDVFEYLANLLSDPVIEVQDEAINAVASEIKLGNEVVKQKIVDLLGSEDYIKKKNAISVLGFTGDSQFDSYLYGLIKDENPEIRKEAIAALGRMKSEKVFEYINFAILDNSPGVRMAAIEALANFPLEKTVALLKMAVSDADIWVRVNATRLIATKGSVTEKPFILNLFANDIPLVKIAIMESLAKIGDDDFIGLAVGALSDKEPEVVKASLKILSGIENPGIDDALRGLLDHDRYDIRYSTLKCIESQGIDRFRKAVTDRLKVEDSQIIKEAIKKVLGA